MFNCEAFQAVTDSISSVSSNGIIEPGRGCDRLILRMFN